MTSRLTEIIENKKMEVAARRGLFAQHSVLSEEESKRGENFLRALQKPGLNLICELKPKSPSAGVLKADFDAAKILPHYQKEAAAISVLTDHKYFGGSLQLLEDVAAATSLPLLCKDFIVEPFQCLEAAKSGASAILLMVKVLTEDMLLKRCHQAALEFGLAPVVEVQNEAELQRALTLDPQIILINNRNLDTFEMDMQTTRRLVPLIPERIVQISASGFTNRIDIQALSDCCHNFLIGSSLMQAEDLSAKLRELKGVTA